MMKYVVVTAVLLLAGCSKSDNGFAALEGFYSLESIICYCPPIELVPNEQQWYLDPTNGTIEVVSEANEQYEILASGVYELTVTPDGAMSYTGVVDLLEVADQQFAIFQSGDTLHLSTDIEGNIADAPEYIFMKN